jgi:hypothetical protein
MIELKIDDPIKIEKDLERFSNYFNIIKTNFLNNEESLGDIYNNSLEKDNTVSKIDVIGNSNIGWKVTC